MFKKWSKLLKYFGYVHVSDLEPGMWVKINVFPFYVDTIKREKLDVNIHSALLWKAHPQVFDIKFYCARYAIVYYMPMGIYSNILLQKPHIQILKKVKFYRIYKSTPAEEIQVMQWKLEQL